MDTENTKGFRLTIALFVALGLYALLLLAWGFLQLSNPETDGPYLLFGATYGLMALFGGVYGLLFARKWGGMKSALGRVVIFLSLGLVFAEFGQLVFSYYNIIKEVEVPYPSLADVGFFGNIPLYVLAALSLTKVVGARIKSNKTLLKRLVFALIPVILLGASYAYFLKDYEFTDTPKLNVFLDFGYPLGQALYVALAVVVFVTSSNVLGGVMKSRILLLLGAFVAQYAADFNFLFQVSRGTWQNGGYGDLLYLTAYFLMTLSLVHILNVFNVKQPVAQPVAVAGNNE